ncbi:MAG: hypothetical protein ACTSV7_08820, partial [Candidatus Baldrarchaeia archaeon]
MSEENVNEQAAEQEGQEGQEQDPLKNFKIEVNRKIDNTNANFDSLKQMNQDLLAAVKQGLDNQTVQQSEGEAKGERIDPIDDPEGFERQILAKAKEVSQQATQQKQREQDTLIGLMTTYPELQDTKSELALETSRQAQQYATSNLPADVVYRLATQQAVEKLGIVPSQHRTAQRNEEDGFQLGGGSHNTREPAKKKDTL